MQKDEDEYVVTLGYKFAKDALENLKKWGQSVQIAKKQIEKSLEQPSSIFKSKNNIFKLSGNYEDDLNRLDKLLESKQIKNKPYSDIRKAILEQQRSEFNSFSQRSLEGRESIINRIASGRITDRQLLRAYNIHIVNDIPVEGRIKSVEELIKSSENLKYEDMLRKEEEKQFKKREREEYKKNQEEMKEIKKRTRVVRDLITSVFQLGSIGGLSWIAGKLFRRTLGGVVKYGEQSSNIQTNAMSLHTTPSGVQRVANWFMSRGIEGEKGINFLKQYATKTGQYYAPAETLLSNLIKEAKKPGADALAAEMNTGDASIFRMLKNYNGNLNSDLLSNDRYILTDIELAKLEKAKNDLISLWNKLLTTLAKITVSIIDWIPNFRSSVKTFLGQKDSEFRKKIEANKPQLETIGQNILQKNEIEKYKYDFIKGFFKDSQQQESQTESKNITINNNFNISGESPERIAFAVKNIFDDSNWLNNIDIIPQMVT